MHSLVSVAQWEVLWCKGQSQRRVLKLESWWTCPGGMYVQISFQKRCINTILLPSRSKEQGKRKKKKFRIMLILLHLHISTPMSIFTSMNVWKYCTAKEIMHQWVSTCESYRRVALESIWLRTLCTHACSSSVVVLMWVPCHSTFCMLSLYPRKDYFSYTAVYTTHSLSYTHCTQHLSFCCTSFVSYYYSFTQYCGTLEMESRSWKVKFGKCT